MTEDWVVLKFGGTSVSGRPQWETISSLIRQRLNDGHRVAVVCSAVAGVTNALSALAENPGSLSRMRHIIDRHLQLSAELEVAPELWLEHAKSVLQRCTRALQLGVDYPAQAELLSLGEWLSTRVGAAFLGRQGPVDWVDSRSALIVEDEPQLSPVRRSLSAACKTGADPALRLRWQQLAPALITQGYVAGTRQGGTALLGRGGSDTSAALLAGRLQATALEIWTDVPGLFTADPRVVPQALQLLSLEYEEALEMAASGARVVHPRCIRAAAETLTPVVVRDTHSPQLRGTRIVAPSAARTGRRAGVKAITSQSGMAVMLLQNVDIRREVGFLARVFGVFQQHGVSIDLVSTSEATTTVALNQSANHLDTAAMNRLMTDLASHCKVTPYFDCVCVNLVGTQVRTALGKLHRALDFFDDHNLLMLSHSANDSCISLLVESAGHEQLIQKAHQALIPAAAAAPGDVFGPSWTTLKRVS